jgi:hypothetical protein
MAVPATKRPGAVTSDTGLKDSPVPNVTRATLTLKRRTLQPSAKPAPVPEAPYLERVFFVWAPDGLRPKKRHATAEAARAEAARLRAIAPEREFWVYEAHRVEGGAP